MKLESPGFSLAGERVGDGDPGRFMGRVVGKTQMLIATQRCLMFIMHARCVMAIFLCFCSSSALAQISGRLYLDKESYAPGEPVFLRFEAKNEGRATQTILQASPYSFCSGYRVHVSSDPGDRSFCASQGFAGSCLSSIRRLTAGETLSEQMLLNYAHNIKSPGDYDVDAFRSLEDSNTGTPVFEVKVRLHFRIDQVGETSVAQFEPWVKQLHSKDILQKMEAARMLASMAPHSLEGVLLSFVDDKDLRTWAPLALSRLHTERSLQALEQLLQTSTPGSFEHLESARYLGETGDARWFPVLADLARKHAQISNYMSYAAQAGGDKALPLLLELLQSPDKEFSQFNAAMALGDTGSRNAVPILLNLLKNPNSGLSERALYSLRQLTHRTYGDSHTNIPSQDQFSSWLQWWNREGSSAHIYKANECGEFNPLN